MNTIVKRTTIDVSSLDDLRSLCIRPLPHPDTDVLRAEADLVLRWLLDHSETLADQSIGRIGTRAEMQARLREPLPEQGRPLEEVLATFAEHVAPFCFRVNHPRFFAFIPSAPTFTSVLGDLLCAGTNFFAGVWLEAAGAAEVELLVLDWFKEILGLPHQASGLLTGGGSEANLTALVTAREQLPLAERPRAVLYVSEQRHWSIDRAARVMGLTPEQVRPVTADAAFRLDPAALVRAVEADRNAGRRPWAVVANAGATNTGAVDPLDALAEVCSKERLWFHVDAAYGWSAALTSEGQRVFHGIARADSVTLDPHKWFAQTFEAGCLLVRDPRLLDQTYHLRPEYMQDVQPDGEEVNFCDRGIALTRRFRALKIWLSLKVLGVSWFRQMIEHSMRLADYAQARLEQTQGFQIVSPRQLSILCFRHQPSGVHLTDSERDEHNLRILETVRHSGRAFLSSTRLRGQVAARLCFVNWRTSADDVDEVVALLDQAARVSGSAP